MKKPADILINSKRRSAEILGVFTKHNFFSGGLTPEELRTTLEELGPTYVKIGQIMSSRTDVLPESYCKELEKLRSDVQALDAQIARNVIEQETGRKIEDIYSEFCDEPLGSASIAQAHFGILKDGTKVVTKVQRPYIADMVRKDFVLLKKLAAVVNVAAEADESGGMVDLKSVIAELEHVTEEELDFRVEAEHTRTFRNRCIVDTSRVSCPTVIDELTTERIMTQTYVDGYSIAKLDRADAEGIDRNKVGKAIVESYLHQVLDVGIFHGDPHQGNIMISNGVAYWIDFGMIGHLSEQNISMIQEIVMNLLQKNSEQLVNIILTMGMVTGTVDKAKLIEDADVLVDRYMSMKDLSHINMGDIMTDMTRIMTAHHIKMPSEFTMLVRSLVTIEGVLEMFCPDLNLFDFLTRKMAERMKESFDLHSKFTELMKDAAAFRMEAAQVPGAVFTLLRNLSKGRMKLNIELTGYERLLSELKDMVKYVILSIFSCVLFSGSCVLCTTEIEPEMNGIPFVALIGFVVSVALALHTISRMIKKR